MNVKFGLLDRPIGHTHTVYSTRRPWDLLTDFAEATNRIEFVVDWGSNITYFNSSGTLYISRAEAGLINHLGFIVRQ